MINLNEAVKRERAELCNAVVEQQQNDEKPKSKRQKKTARPIQQQQPLTIQQQQKHEQGLVKVNPQIFQQPERQFQQQSQPQTGLGVRRYVRAN